MACVSVIIPYRERPAPGLNHIHEAIKCILVDKKTGPWDKGPRAKRRSGNYDDTKIWGDPKSTWWMP